MANWNQRSFRLLQRTRVHLSPLVDATTPASCGHLGGRGAVNGAVRSVHRALPRSRFVARFDIQSYYESLRHDVVLRQVAAAGVDVACHSVAGHYTRLPDRFGSGRGIVAGGFLWPLLGALNLAPLDRAMELSLASAHLVPVLIWCGVRGGGLVVPVRRDGALDQTAPQEMTEKVVGPRQTAMAT